jgi:hypothetical protein
MLGRRDADLRRCRSFESMPRASRDAPLPLPLSDGEVTQGVGEPCTL